MKSRVLTTALLMAAILAAGCSKSESDNMEENNSLNRDERVNIIKQHLVGKWAHDGNLDMGSGLESTPGDISYVSNDDYSLLLSSDERLTFRMDDSVTLIASPDKIYEGRYHFVHGDILSFGIQINYDIDDWGSRPFSEFSFFMFSKDERFLFLSSHYGTSRWRKL